MQNIIDAIWTIPDYILDLAQVMLIPCIITLIVFLLVLLFSGKVFYFLRCIYVVAGFLAIAYAFFIKKYELFWIILASFILLIIVRAIISGVRASRLNKEIAKIEKEALARSAERRGSWEAKKGYSGEERPIASEEYKPGNLTEDSEDPGVSESENDGPV